jgi:oligopeptide transport system substrate-binding protein
MKSIFSTLVVLLQIFALGASAATPKTLSIALSTEPPNLNSTKATDAESFFILGHIMEGLTRYGKKGEQVPGVAEKWTMNDKGATFNLRKTAKWSDGKPVTAKDFVFAWQRVVDPKNASEYAFIMYPIKNAEAINKGKMGIEQLGAVAKDDYTLEVSFEKPCGYFIGLTAFGVYMPVREDIWNAKKDRYAADVADLASNGPFKLTKWVHGASLSMEKNENYWNKGVINLDRIDVPYITPDNNARFNFFKDKKIDLVGLTKDDLPKAQTEGYKLNKFSDGTLFFLEFNFRQGRPTANKNLRKAIASVFNPGEYIKTVVGIPGTTEGNRLIPGWLRGQKDLFAKEYPLRAIKPNLTEAKKYLEAAKKELGGTIPPLVWLTGDTALSAKEAEYFQSLFKSKLGLELRIDKQIFKQRLAKMTAGEFDIVAAGWGPDYNDPMTFADLWTSWNENNRGKYTSTEVDTAVREAMNTADPKKRMDAMAKAEKIALDDLAALPLFERTIMYVHHPRVDGIVRHQVGPDPDLTLATIKE